VKRLKRVFTWLFDNLPLFLAFGAAVWSYYEREREAMYFFLILAGLFVVIRDLSEIKEILKQPLEIITEEKEPDRTPTTEFPAVSEEQDLDVQPDPEPETKGRHSA
jgi:hypothetical protein